MAELAAGCLDDPRVHLVQADVADVIAAGRGLYDAILLDVDNGPDGLVRQANDRLYSAQGLSARDRCAQAGRCAGDLVGRRRCDLHPTPRCRPACRSMKSGCGPAATARAAARDLVRAEASLDDLVRRERRRAQALAGRREDRVGDRRDDRRQRGLTQARGRIRRSAGTPPPRRAAQGRCGPADIGGSWSP